MIEPKKFLEDFTKDIVANPGTRPEHIKAYEIALQRMLDEARKEAPKEVAKSCYECGTQLWEFDDRFQCVAAGCGSYESKATRANPETRA